MCKWKGGFTLPGEAGYEDLTLKEISYVLEVTESRVSQLHTKALQKMKTKLGKYIGILEQL